MKITVLSAILIIVGYSSLIASQVKEDSVTVTFTIVVPENTLPDTRIFWAGTLNKWDPGKEGRGMSSEDMSKG